MLCISPSKLVKHQLHKYEVPAPQTVASPLGQESMCVGWATSASSPSSSPSSSSSSPSSSSLSSSLPSCLPSSCLQPDLGAIRCERTLVRSDANEPWCDPMRTNLGAIRCERTLTRNETNLEANRTEPCSEQP